MRMVRPSSFVARLPSRVVRRSSHAAPLFALLACRPSVLACRSPLFVHRSSVIASRSSLVARCLSHVDCCLSLVGRRSTLVDDRSPMLAHPSWTRPPCDLEKLHSIKYILKKVIWMQHDSRRGPKRTNTELSQLFPPCESQSGLQGGHEPLRGAPKAEL